MKSSLFAGSRSWQSASLPGRLAMSSAPLRRVRSRALRAASRAAAASTTLATTFLASAGCSSNHCVSLSATMPSIDRADLGGDQLVLGLRGEFRVRHLDRQDAGQAFAHVLARQRDLLLLGDAAVGRIGVDGAGQRRAKAREMRAAVALRDVVGKAEHRLVIAVGPLHRDLEQDAVALAADRDRRRMQCLLRAVEIARQRLRARPRNAR